MAATTPGMTPTVALLVVGLTPALIGDSTPNLRAFARRGGLRALNAAFPAVTCTAHATFTTGLRPAEHGAVANGWYFRDTAEVRLWQQSNHLVSGEHVWEAGRRADPAFTCAQLFWWYNMYSSADYSVTPRPLYPADGRKIPDCYTGPVDLRDELTAKLGTFPLFNFWGPRADLTSTRWIASCARYVGDTRRPTLTLVYLPHLDYNLQRLGPDDPRLAADLRAVDAVCGELIEHAERRGARVVVLSEYGITPVRGAVHVNRVLREAGLVAIKPEMGTDALDAGASEAFAVADHQVAHVYVRRPERVAEVRALLGRVDGVESVLGEDEKRAAGLDHPRSGELVAVSAADRWFTYYHWLDDARAPDYARTVDIHRKPGYDPVELFLDPAIRFPTLKVGGILARRKLGFRSLLDVTPLDASLVRGSHGRPIDDPAHGPVFISGEPDVLAGALEGERFARERFSGDGDAVDATDVKALLLAHVFGGGRGGAVSTGAAATAARA